MEKKKLRRNLVFLSSTGNGKSSTCNTLVGEEYFVTSDEMNSCTSAAADKIIERLNVRVIDTAGFGDTRFNEKVIDKILADLTVRLTDIDGTGTNKIDAFILVCKCSPRATSIKSDIDHIRNIFGTVALKTLVILIINTDKFYSVTDEKVLTSIRDEMPEIVNMLSEAKGKPFNEKWFVRWDNIKPRPNQEANLLKAIDELEGYTHEKFVSAQKEINDRLDKVINKKIQDGKKQLEKDYKNDKQKLEQKMNEMNAKFEKERQEMQKNAREASMNSEKLIQLFKEMNDGNNTRLKEMLEAAQRQSREEQAALMEQISRNNQNYTQMFQKQNEMFNQQQTQMMKAISDIANRPVIVKGGGGGCLLF